MAPWVRDAGNVAFKTGVRGGVQEIVKSGTKDLYGRLIRPFFQDTAGAPTSSPYEPVGPDKFDFYLKKKEEFDECFARFDKLTDDLRQQANNERWPIEVGWAIYNGFLSGCPALRDKPDPDKAPDPETVKRAAEICMWVQWAQARDWPWWDKQYQATDAGLPPDGRSIAYFLFLDAIRYSDELSPILGRLFDIGYGREVQNVASTSEQLLRSF